MFDEPGKLPASLNKRQALIDCHRVSVWREGACILHDIDVQLFPGEDLALIGPNGSGKSTLVALFAGDLHAEYKAESRIRLFGQEQWSLFELRSKLGFVSDALAQKLRLSCSLEESLLSSSQGAYSAFSRMEVDEGIKTRAQELMAKLGIEKLQKQACATLSTGEMRRFLFARALLHEPPLLLLDEPYHGLDLASRFTIKRLVEDLMRQGRNLIFVTHDFSEIPEGVQNFLALKEGRCFAKGKIEELQNEVLISALYDLPPP